MGDFDDDLYDFGHREEEEVPDPSPLGETDPAQGQHEPPVQEQQDDHEYDWRHGQGEDELSNRSSWSSGKSRRRGQRGQAGKGGPKYRSGTILSHPASTATSTRIRSAYDTIEFV